MGRVWELEPRLFLIWNLSKRNMAQQCPHESLLHYRAWGGGRIRAQKWYLRYTVSLPPLPPRTLHWPFVTETAFSTNLLPEQQTRSKAHFNFCSSRSTVLLRNSKIVLGRPSEMQEPERSWTTHSQDFMLSFISQSNFLIFIGFGLFLSFRILSLLTFVWLWVFYCFSSFFREKVFWRVTGSE